MTRPLMEPLTLRLSAHLLRRVRVRARAAGTTVSVIVREALVSYLLADPGDAGTTGNAIDALVTWGGSGHGDLAREAQPRLREKIRARRRR